MCLLDSLTFPQTFHVLQVGIFFLQTRCGATSTVGKFVVVSLRKSLGLAVSLLRSQAEVAEINAWTGFNEEKREIDLTIYGPSPSYPRTTSPRFPAVERKRKSGLCWSLQREANYQATETFWIGKNDGGDDGTPVGHLHREIALLQLIEGHYLPRRGTARSAQQSWGYKEEEREKGKLGHGWGVEKGDSLWNERGRWGAKSI